MRKQSKLAGPFVDPAIWNSENIRDAVERFCAAVERQTGKGVGHYVGRDAFITISVLRSLMPGLRAEWVERDEEPEPVQENR